MTVRVYSPRAQIDRSINSGGFPRESRDLLRRRGLIICKRRITKFSWGDSILTLPSQVQCKSKFHLSDLNSKETDRKRTFTQNLRIKMDKEQFCLSI